MLKIRTAILLVITFLALLLMSCNTPKRIERKCAKWTAICQPEQRIDSILIRDTVIIRDTIIRYKIRQDTVILEHKFTVPKYLTLDFDTIRKEFGLVGVQAWVTDNRLGVLGYLTDSTILIKSKTKEVIHNEKSHRKEIVRVKENTSFANFTIWFFWIMVIMVIIYIILKLIKIRFKWA